MSNTSLFVSLLLANLAAFAEAPLARVISSSPVVIDGISAPARTYVPVSLGGEVVSQDAAAVIQFSDGGKATLSPRSKVRIEGQSQHPSVKVLAGSATYDAAAPKAKAASARAAVANDAVSVAASKSTMVSPGVVALAAMAGSSSSAPVAAPAQPSESSQSAGAFTGSFVQNAGGGSASLITPSGLTLNLTPVTDANGKLIGYNVLGVSQAITTSTGQTQTVTVTNLTGLSVTVAPQPNGFYEVQFFQYGTPVTSQTATQTINTAINNALPPGTSVNNPTISQGTFSTRAN